MANISEDGIVQYAVNQTSYGLLYSNKILWLEWARN